MTVLNSSIGEIGPEFQEVIDVTLDNFVIPELTRKHVTSHAHAQTPNNLSHVITLGAGLGEEGYEIPKREEIKFVDPEIIPLDTDVSAPPPSHDRVL